MRNAKYSRCKREAFKIMFGFLQAYSLHDTAVSYCQGLSYLAAALLLHMPEEQAFFILNVIMSHEKYNTRQLYLDNFDTLHVKVGFWRSAVLAAGSDLHREGR